MLSVAAPWGVGSILGDKIHWVRTTNHRPAVFLFTFAVIPVGFPILPPALQGHARCRAKTSASTHLVDRISRKAHWHPTRIPITLHLDEAPNQKDSLLTESHSAPPVQPGLTFADSAK